MGWEQKSLAHKCGLNQIWRFSGKDIFATVSDKTAFTIENDSIKLYDFEDNFYELDFNGKLITEIMNMVTN